MKMARNYSEEKIKEVMVETFTEAQHSKSGHRKLIKSLKKVYAQSDFDIFVREFIRCLKFAFIVQEKRVPIENTFEFAAKFAVSLHQDLESANNTNEVESEEDEEEELHPFLENLFEFCLQHHMAVDVAVRYRSCFFINLLLCSMSDDQYMGETMCDTIRNAMFERLVDKSPKVRVQAIGAIHRMQNPVDQSCPIIKLYIYHMSFDPSADVRKAAIENSGKNHKVLDAVLKRISDTDASVRKSAYTFFTKVTPKSLKIDQRRLMLQTGLRETTDSVRRIVTDILLPAWLLLYNDEYRNLLYALDIEMKGPDLGFKVLNILFPMAKIDVMFKQLPLDRDLKLIPIEKLSEELSSENVAYWRCLIEYLYKKSGTDEIANEYLQEIIPELSAFCDYIRDFQKMAIEFAKQNSGDAAMDARHAKQINEMKITHKFIHLQLFEIAKSYDLSDEVGRRNLRQLIEETLMSDFCTIPVIECIVKHYGDVVQDVSSRLTSLAHVISEIRVPTLVADNLVEDMTDDQYEENKMKITRLKNKLMQLENDQYLFVQAKKFVDAETAQQEMMKVQQEIKDLERPCRLIEPQTQEEPKNDPETMSKCLSIMYHMAQSPQVDTLTSTLRSLLDNLATPSLDHSDPAVQVLAFKAVGICLFLDPELARDRLIVFLIGMTADHDNLELWLVSLTVIFDLILRYGLDHFQNIVNPDKTADTTRQTQDGNTSRRQGTRLYSSSDDTGLSLEETGDKQNLINIVLGTIDHMDRDVRTTAITGFCKLLLHGKLKSHDLLSSFLIKFFDPLTEKDVDARGMLLAFFRNYPKYNLEGSTCLQQAFIPTLNKLLEAPNREIFVEPYHIAKFIIDLTRGDPNHKAHNQLAFDILGELSNEESNMDEKMLAKSLTQLVIRCDDDVMKDRLRAAVDRAVDIIEPRETAILKSLRNFRSQFEVAEEPEVRQETHGRKSPEVIAPRNGRQSPEFDAPSEGRRSLDFEQVDEDSEVDK